MLDTRPGSSDGAAAGASVIDAEPSGGGAAAVARPRRRGTWHFFRDFPRVVPYVRRYWALLAASVAMIGASAAVGVVAPWPLAIVIDHVLGHRPLPSILRPLLGHSGRYLVLALATSAGLVMTMLAHGLTVVENYVSTKLEQRTTVDFRSDLFSHAQRLSLSFHDRMPTGGLMYRINEQANALGQIVVAFPPLAQGLLMLVGMFAISYEIDSELALLALTAVPFVYYSIGSYAKRVEPRIYKVRNLEGQSLSIIYEAMSMLRVTIAFGRERHEYHRFRSQADRAVDARVQLTVRQTLFSLAIGTITAAGTSLVLGIGALHVIEHKLTVGELVVLLGYIAAIYQPLQQISYTMSTLQQQFVGLRSVLELLELDADISDAPDAAEVDRAAGAVSFEDVVFVYRSPALEKLKQDRLAARAAGAQTARSSPLRQRRWTRADAAETEAMFDLAGLESSEREPALKGISFDVPPGRRVALVGPTGAGKSTLVGLIPRFYDVAEGAVCVDGVDVRRLTLRSLRRQISIVHQEPLLFAGSIYDNIRYGREDATDDDVLAAAQAANAHEFVSRLPNGYQTEIGERGAQLSGGERQRICVARAFLKDAPILILDEPTSSIDSQTEAVILEALDRLMEGRTTFLVAHRLATIRGADLILVMSDGEIVERGTHDELLAQNGLYSVLWGTQTGVLDRSEVAAAVLRRQQEEAVRRIEPPGPEHQRTAAVLVTAVATALRTGRMDKIRERSTTMRPRARRVAASLLVALAEAMLDDTLEPLRALTGSIAHTGLPARLALALTHDATDACGLRATGEALRAERARGAFPARRFRATEDDPWLELVDEESAEPSAAPAFAGGA